MNISAPVRPQACAGLGARILATWRTGSGISRWWRHSWDRGVWRRRRVAPRRRGHKARLLSSKYRPGGHRTPGPERLRAQHTAATRRRFSETFHRWMCCWSQSRRAKTETLENTLRWTVGTFLTFMFMSASSRTFSAFKSRWTTPFRWQ